MGNDCYFKINITECINIENVLEHWTYIVYAFFIACDIIIKIIFIVIGIKRLLKIKKDMNIEKKYLLYQNLENSQLKINKEKWTCPSMIKFIFNKLIVLLYLSLIIIFSINFDLIHNIYYIISFITWIISTRLFYKEFRIYKDQTWNGIRIFWILTFILNILELANILYFFFSENDKKISFSDFKFLIVILFSTICFISFILFLLAIIHPYDVSIEKKIKEEEKIINDDPNDTRISTEIQDELFNSDDEFMNEEDISFHNLENMKIEVNDNEGLNLKQYNIELKIKTLDFKQLIFSLKIQKVKHKRIKLPINVSNFNEVILKYYKKRDISKDIINLLKQAYNISLTLNPQRNSFTGDKKNANLLAHLYREIIKKDNQFLLDLLYFLKIKSNDLINCLSDNYTSIYKDNPSVEKEIERIDTLGSIFDNFDDIGFTDITKTTIKKQKSMEDNKFPKSEIKFKSKIDDFDNNIITSVNSDITPKKRSLITKDYISFSSLINNILINKRFITVQIVNYEDITQNLNFLLKSKRNKNEIFIQLNIDTIHDILCDDELSNYIIDYSENVNSKQSKEKQIMEELFNSYLNNVFYYDENIFQKFNLNRLINLDIDKFNNEIINNFFNEKISNIGKFEDDIRQYLFDIKIKIYKDNNDIKPLINDGNIEISLSKTNEGKILDKDKKIEPIINIIKLYLIIENMIFVLNNKIKRYSELSGTLNNTRIYNGKLLNIIYNIKEEELKNIKNYRIKDAVYGDEKMDSIVTELKTKFSDTKIQINAINQEVINEINKEIKNLNTCFNSLLNKSNIKYVLYFTSFRDILEFSNLF